MSPITAIPQISTAKDYKELCVQAVNKILSLSQKAIKEQGRCTIVLSGGSTPQGVYSLMATPPYCDQFDWKSLHFFLGDERWVPKESPRSNYKMIMDSLFRKINFPLSNFHAIQTDTADVETSAELFEKELMDYFALKPNEFPQFDLILLGLGQDGHTASLFPNHAVLNENKCLAVSVEARGIAEKRITLTLPVINHAQAVFFLVSGTEKAEVLKKVLKGKENKFFPAGKVSPEGQVWWFVDKAAAFLLENKNEAAKKK